MPSLIVSSNMRAITMDVLQKGIVLKMQKIHLERLNVAYHSSKTYDEFSELIETAIIHQWQLRFLVIEVFKSTSYLRPQFM